MHKISALAHVSEDNLKLGYERIGRSLARSLDLQGLSANKAVEIINKIYRSGEGVGRVTPGQFGKFIKGHVLFPNYATICDLAPMIYKPSHFLITSTDKIGQPVIKTNRLTQYEELIVGTARKAEDLPNFEMRCSGSDLINIILDPPLVTELPSYSGRTPLYC